jgi:DNA-binding GntR family transcriptional regulator
MDEDNGEEVGGRATGGEHSAVAGATFDPGLVDDLADRIHARILTGEFAVGTWLRQEALANEFGVSRTPVREALRKLQADRLVDVLPQRGALVRGPTASDVREVYLIRADLEGLAAELSASLIDGDQLRRMRDAEEAFRAAVAGLSAAQRAALAVTPARSAALVETDFDFHSTIVEASRLGRLPRLVTDLRRSLPEQAGWAALGVEPTLLDEVVIQHARVRGAIERGDASGARRWMTDHLRRSGDLVVAWFEARESQGAESGPAPISAAPLPLGVIAPGRLRRGQG